MSNVKLIELFRQSKFISFIKFLTDYYNKQENKNAN